MPKSIEGIFLHPSEAEAKLIWEKVQELGYDHSGEGVTQMLLDFLREDEEGSGGEMKRLRAHFKAHPEDLQMVMGVLGNAGRGLVGLVARMMKKP